MSHTGFIMTDKLARNAKAYDQSKACTFKQRLALTLGAAQNKRPAKVWA